MKAIAYVVGPDDGPAATLKQLARQIGFDAVYGYRSLAAAEKAAHSAPLVFFLFAAAESLKKLKTTAHAIRTSENLRIKFAPMIYFSERASLEITRNCIHMGFDDIITLPFTLSRVEERLERQVDRPLIYYETPNYFGPDRRDRGAEDGQEHLRGTGGQHRRLEVLRTPASGISVNVLHDDLHVML